MGGGQNMRGGRSFNGEQGKVENCPRRRFSFHNLQAFQIAAVRAVVEASTTTTTIDEMMDTIARTCAVDEATSMVSWVNSRKLCKFLQKS